MGGGHYYAYIRPNGSMGFDYEAFAAHGETNTPIQESEPGPYKNNVRFNERKKNDEKVEETKKDLLDRKARDGQWFKFNDEFVLKVKHSHYFNYSKILYILSLYFD